MSKLTMSSVQATIYNKGCLGFILNDPVKLRQVVSMFLTQKIFRFVSANVVRSQVYINNGILTGMAIARRESRLNNVDARDSAAILALKVSFSSKDIERPFTRGMVVNEECKAWLPGMA
jgi:hypothetical protein